MQNQVNQYQFDASEYIIGRLATEVARLLMGKNLVSYEPNIAPNVEVSVYNAGKIKFTGKKLKNKLYYKHTQYPGHLKIKTLEELLIKDSREVIRKAVYNMLPKNKLRYRMMKNLLIYKGEKK